MGSKARIAKYILPIIQKRLVDYDIHTYIEPFAGGMNMIDKVQCDNKIASDNNKYLIEIFRNLSQIQDLPEFITKEHYSEVRECFNKGLNTYPDWYIGQLDFLQAILVDFLMVGIQVLYIQKLIQKETITMKQKEIY